VDNIINGNVFNPTMAMKKGLMLENDILKKIEEKYGYIKQSGFVIFNPLFGASPDDGINSDYVFEMKCPSKTSTDINDGRT
jgi:hypothetical protein